MRRAYLMAVPIAGAAVFACQLLVGIDDRKVAVDGGIGAEGGPADPCLRVGYPDQPDPKTSNASDNITLTAVLHKLNLGVDGTNYGFNLDQTCTCPGPESCNLPPNVVMMGKMACDKDGSIPSPLGSDNAGVDIFRIFPDAGTLEQMFNDSLALGIAGVMVQIQNYNGMPDDADVKVSIYPLLRLAGDGGTPKWDGSDTWVPDSTAIQGGNSIYLASKAWVSTGKLVAAMRIPVIIGSSAVSAVRVDLQDGYVVAQLQLNGTKLVKMTGELGGRWIARDFLTTLGNVPDPTNMSQNLCKGDPFYDSIVKPIVCNARDIASGQQLDNKGSQCDSVSMALGFEALPANAGTPAPPPNPGPVCGVGVGYSDTCSN